MSTAAAGGVTESTVAGLMESAGEEMVLIAAEAVGRQKIALLSPTFAAYNTSSTTSTTTAVDPSFHDGDVSLALARNSTTGSEHAVLRMDENGALSMEAWCALDRKARSTFVTGQKGVDQALLHL